MDNEERVMANAVIKESNTTLAVQALQEANEQLQGEVEFLKEENKRLRNVSRLTRMTSRKVRSEAKTLLEQVEEMGKHIMDIAAEEVFVDAEPPLAEYPNIQMFEGWDGTMVPLQKSDSHSPLEKAERKSSAENETMTRAWLDKQYHELRNEGVYPTTVPLSPAEIYDAAQDSDSTSDGTKTT